MARPWCNLNSIEEKPRNPTEMCMRPQGYLKSLAFAVILAGAPAASAFADALDLKATLADIEQLAQQSPQKALDRLHAIQAAMDASTTYEVRQRLLREEIWLLEDAGRMEESYQVERQAYDLAMAHKDLATAARASLGEVHRLLGLNRPDDAQSLLDKILATAPKDMPTLASVAFARTQGDILNAKARYDKALEAYLDALTKLEGDPLAGEPRATLLARIAQVYSNNDHPQKALEAAERGLAESGVALRTRGSLQFSEAIAHLRLGKKNEALSAFQKALATAEKAGLAGLEAAIRGNISDFFLQQKDYPRAELEARKALEVSKKVKNQSLLQMAEANLGFALMGQGKLAEGLPFVDGVIQEMRDAGATADLEAMLDEKGRMLESAGKFADALAVVREQQGLQLRNARNARDKAIAALQENFDAAQRTRQIALLKRENDLKDAEITSRRTVQVASTFAAILTILAGAIVFVLYRRAARSNAQLKLLNTQLEYHSTRDALTGLHNRRSFLAKMKGLAEGGKHNRRSTAQAHSSCFILFDLDHFKSINDRWGHVIGDAVLVEIARRMMSTLRDTDMVLRWGGEEFMVYAPDTDPTQLPRLAARILNAVGSSKVDTDCGPIAVSISAGAVSLPIGENECRDWEVAVKLADWALYQSKANGRNQASVIARIGGDAEAVVAILEGRAERELAPDMLQVDKVPGPASS